MKYSFNMKGFCMPKKINGNPSDFIGNPSLTNILNILKKITLLLFVTTCNLAFAQQESSILEKKITLSMPEASISEVLHALEAKADCKFTYNIQHVDTLRKVRISYQELPLREALSQLFGPSLKKVHAHGNIVDFHIHGPKGKIAGKLTDPKGEPLPFAAITLKGTAVASTTDENGNYEMDAH